MKMCALIKLQHFFRIAAMIRTTLTGVKIMRQARPNRQGAEGKAEIAISRLAKPVHPVVSQIAENLAKVDAMRIVKLTPGFLKASSEACGAQRQPVTKPGHPTAIGVSLILDENCEEVQFYEITSAVKGHGSAMVEAVLRALPRQWKVLVPMDWSGGFWKAMRRRHRRIVLL